MTESDVFATSETSKQSKKSNLFKNIWRYLVKFLKAPITTMENDELGFKEAAVLLGVLPFSLFLSIRSLIRSLINSISRAVSLEITLIDNIAARAFAEINWWSIFFNGLLVIAIWFALMIFVPLILAKIIKISQPFEIKKLFSQIVVITIPMILLYLLATIFGFIRFGLWFLPAVVSLIIPLLLHFVAIRNTCDESPNKVFYITFMTQVVIIIIAAFWLNTHVNIMGIMSDLLWN